MLNNELWAATNTASLEFVEFCLHAAQCGIRRNELWRGPCSAYDKEFVRGWTDGMRVWSFTLPCKWIKTRYINLVWLWLPGLFCDWFGQEIWILCQARVFKRALGVRVWGRGRDGCAFQGYLHLESFPPLQPKWTEMTSIWHQEGVIKEAEISQWKSVRAVHF